MSQRRIAAVRPPYRVILDARMSVQIAIIPGRA